MVDARTPQIVIRVTEPHVDVRWCTTDELDDVVDRPQDGHVAATIGATIDDGAGRVAGRLVLHAPRLPADVALHTCVGGRSDRAALRGTTTARSTERRLQRVRTRPTRRTGGATQGGSTTCQLEG